MGSNNLLNYRAAVTMLQSLWKESVQGSAPHTAEGEVEPTSQGEVEPTSRVEAILPGMEQEVQATVCPFVLRTNIASEPHRTNTKIMLRISLEVNPILDLLIILYVLMRMLLTGV